MPIQCLCNKFVTVAIGLGLLLLGGWAHADPPLRVARLGVAQGQVSFLPAGERNNWVQATVNRPLTTGDQLWVDASSRAEVQIGGTAIRLGENTSVTLLNVDDNITQIQLVQGTLKMHVRSIDTGQILEVDTPNLAMTVHRPGDFRLDVGRNGDATEVSVRNGEAELYGEGASYSVREGQSKRFFGTGLSDYENLTSHTDDELDRWAYARDHRTDISIAARYVSPQLVGYEDLDADGAWRNESSYGYVWVPHRVRTDWTPYSDGHWSWIAPWGWTWVDAAPWGYAVSHYGRWANIRGTWAWVPGPLRERAVYAPALVVFVGGRDFPGANVTGGMGAVGWFPLAPREVYRPAYQTSPRYFEYINRSNAVIAPALITNVYNTHTTNVTNVTNVTRVTNITNVIYANQSVRGAVVAVPSQVFAQSQPVAKAAIIVPNDAAARAPVEHIVSVVPVAQSMQRGMLAVSAKPPEHMRQVISRTAPPVSPLAFAAQSQPPQSNAKPAVPTPALPPVQPMTTAKPPASEALFPPVPARGGKPFEDHKPDIAKTVPTPVDPARAMELKAEAMRMEAAKSDAAHATAARADGEKARVVRAEVAKADTAKADFAKAADAQRAAMARAEAEKSKAAREDAAREDAARANAAREGAARAAAAHRAEAEQARAVHEEAARANAARAEAARATAMREESAKAHVAKPVATPNPAPPAPSAPQHPQHTEHPAKEKKDKTDEDGRKH